MVQDVRENGVDQVSPATVYWPSLMDDPSASDKLGAWRNTYFAIRSSRAGTPAFIHEMVHTVGSVNAKLPVAEISTMREIYGDCMARTSFTLVMLPISGVMALALGILGIYGVISYAISQRTREIGIRMALGAKKNELAWMFIRTSLLLAGVGTAVGLGSAAALMRLLRTLLFRISPLDPLTFTSVPVVLAAALASYLPASAPQLSILSKHFAPNKKGDDHSPGICRLGAKERKPLLEHLTPEDGVPIRVSYLPE